VRQILSARGAIDGEAAERLKRIELLFGSEWERAAGVRAIGVPDAKSNEERKAS
jgi:hypothetical protein